MIFEKIKAIVAEQLGLSDTSEITPETSLINDLDADSLDAVEIIMSIEDEFDVEIPDEVAEGFKSIGSIVEYVEKNM
jgi:acyl carrier protein